MQRIFFPAVKILLAPLILFTLLAGCGGKTEVKEVSKDSKMATESFEIAESIRAAYVRKNFVSISDISTKEAYKEIIDSVKHFDSVDLTFTPRWVEIEHSKVVLNVSWKGNWTVGKDVIKERGMAVFQFEGSPLKLAKIVRGNPFQYPER